MIRHCLLIYGNPFYRWEGRNPQQRSPCPGPYSWDDLSYGMPAPRACRSSPFDTQWALAKVTQGDGLMVHSVGRAQAVESDQAAFELGSIYLTTVRPKVQPSVSLHLPLATCKKEAPAHRACRGLPQTARFLTVSEGRREGASPCSRPVWSPGCGPGSF